jgi:ABC-type uncharacterized transport system permease subunit
MISLIADNEIMGQGFIGQIVGSLLLLYMIRAFFLSMVPGGRRPGSFASFSMGRSVVDVLIGVILLIMTIPFLFARRSIRRPRWGFPRRRYRGW